MLIQTPLREKQKPLAPVRDERCRARGTTPVRHVLADRDLSLCIHRNPLTGVSRRRLLMHFSAVRGEAPRSYSPANPIPLLSDRGSLHRLDRLLILIVALTIFNCRRALCTRGMGAVNERVGVYSVCLMQTVLNEYRAIPS